MSITPEKPLMNDGEGGANSPLGHNEPVKDTLHTVTFYSFKGGVGRTQALLNVAVLLARVGNRVAIVDFDLEAPGIDAYKGFDPARTDQPGLLEYVSKYTESAGREVPWLGSYVYESKAHQPGEFDDENALFVIRAGRQDEEYRRRLTALNWDRLFTHLDGHLFFANMKAELFDEFGCNFLLIDSRTGLTDVAGVCTAYLPDAVMLMFYPDEQNKRGIATVAKAIKEYGRRENRYIPRMYCASRVPNIAERRELAYQMAHALTWDEPGRRPPNWTYDAYINAASIYGGRLGRELRQNGGIAYGTGTGDYFGGVPICVLPERPPTWQEPAAAHADPGFEVLMTSELDEYWPYVPLVTFAAYGNRLELNQRKTFRCT